MKLESKSKRLRLSVTLVLFGLGLAALPATAATYTDIIVPNSLATSADGINNLGQVVGYYELPSNQIAGFLLSGGNYTSITFNGEPNTFATAINDFGLIAGYVQTQNIGTPYFGFTYQNGKFLAGSHSQVLRAHRYLASTIPARSWALTLICETLPMVLNTAPGPTPASTSRTRNPP